MTLEKISERIFSGSTPLSKGDAYVEPPNGIRFLRSGEITEDGSVTNSSDIHISEYTHNVILRRSQIKHGDILIAIVGATIGKVGIYDRLESSNINQAIAAVRLKNSKILSKYICYYLLSDLGQTIFDYFKRPVARANINLEEVGEIPVLIPAISKQLELVNVLDEARSQRLQKLERADELLSSFDDYLLTTLGLDRPIEKNRDCFAVSFSKINGRFDPYFYSPQFENIRRMLSKINAVKLGKLVLLSDETWRSEESLSSTFRYIEISDVNPKTGEAKWEEIPVKEAPSRARMVVKADDIIVSLTRPHHGSIAHLSERFDGCIASTGFAVIRQVSPQITKEYLWCILRGQFSLQQMLQRSSGGNYPAIIKSELAKIVIPVPDLSIQRAIVSEINHRREEARRLRVEAETEWQKAKQWFEEQLLGSNPL